MQKSIQIYLLLFVALALIGVSGSLLYPKETLSVWIAGHRFALANSFFIYVTKLGEWYPFSWLFVWLLAKKEWQIAARLSVLVVGAIVLANTLKDYFHHERPSLYMSFHNNHIEDLGQIPGVVFLDGSSSFPSGHTLGAFTLFTFIALYTSQQKTAFLWLLPAVLVGVSRIYLGHHFLEDVVFGAFLGVVWAFLLGFRLQKH